MGSKLVHRRSQFTSSHREATAIRRLGPVSGAPLPRRRLPSAHGKLETMYASRLYATKEDLARLASVECFIGIGLAVLMRRRE
eukprot:5881158-Karenia_brevis.AAC.1